MDTGVAIGLIDGAGLIALAGYTGYQVNRLDKLISKCVCRNDNVHLEIKSIKHRQSVIIETVKKLSVELKEIKESLVTAGIIKKQELDILGLLDEEEEVSPLDIFNEDVEAEDDIDAVVRAASASTE